MGILRSEQMRHGTLVLPVERARHFIDLIGSNCNMQFEDMNSSNMRRPYRKYVQRLDELERVLRFLFDELSKIPGSEVMKNNVDAFLGQDHAYKLDAVESELKKLYDQFMRFKENNADLNEQRNAAFEERCVMQTAEISLGAPARENNAEIVGRASAREDFDFNDSRSLLGNFDEDRAGMDMTFSNIAGVVNQSDQERFARTLFRATRGNTYTHFQAIVNPVKDPKTSKEVHKSVFVVYYQDNRLGGGASAMSDKIKKICQSFGTSLYTWPASREEAERRTAHLTQLLQDKERAVAAYERFVLNEARVMLAPGVGGNSKIEEWRLFCAKEKAIYHQLNMFEGEITLRANAWYPAAEEESIRQLLIRQSTGQQSSAMLVSDRQLTKRNPPTYIRTNQLTQPFQELIDTYGVPMYGEANPALLTLITFPFLFGVMYGDVGHGLMLFLVGLWAVFNAEKLKYEVPALYMARYMITMMGFFAIYAGFMYNDLFSLGMDLFGTRWKHTKTAEGMEYFEPAYDAKNNGGAGPYPFGLDPTWHGAQNELLFVNSLKMKISVLFGVAQMIVGVLLRWSNSWHESSLLDFICEGLPMMVFMICFFAYMDFMIMYKWVTPLDNPPSIINSLICMAMGQPDNFPLYNGAVVVSQVLMVLTMLSVPVMLLPKPIILYFQHQNSVGHGHDHGHGDEEGGKDDHEHAEGFNFGEVMIHQIIETIEYVLGTVSHTASYLRLWALSLAHQQLSLVFFQKTIMVGMTMSFPGNGVALWFLFAAWFGITVGVLLGMDVLECFLHTLRLHWVEFQSKFYKADGYRFQPYRHKSILEPKDE